MGYLPKARQKKIYRQSNGTRSFLYPLSNQDLCHVNFLTFTETIAFCLDCQSEAIPGECILCSPFRIFFSSKVFVVHDCDLFGLS